MHLLIVLNDITLLLAALQLSKSRNHPASEGIALSEALRSYVAELVRLRDRGSRELPDLSLDDVNKSLIPEAMGVAGPASAVAVAFSLLHETGHLLSPRYASARAGSNEGHDLFAYGDGDAEEIQADDFAAARLSQVDMTARLLPQMPRGSERERGVDFVKSVGLAALFVTFNVLQPRRGLLWRLTRRTGLTPSKRFKRQALKLLSAESARAARSAVRFSTLFRFSD